MEQQFDATAADAMLFENEPTTVKIGGREIEIKPLNLAGIKVVLAFIKGSLNPIFSAYMDYRKELQAFEKAEDGATPPNPVWWFGLIEERLDDLYLVITHVLQRGDPTLTLAFVQEHLNPLVDLQRIFPLIIKQNHLDQLVKNVLTSQMKNAAVEMAKAGAFPIRSTSQTSPSISAGIMESTSTTSPDETADTPSLSASSSTTESLDTSA